MDQVLDCALEVSKFELSSRYYVLFRTWERYGPSYSPSRGLNSITAGRFGIK